MEQTVAIVLKLLDTADKVTLGVLRFVIDREATKEPNFPISAVPVEVDGVKEYEPPKEVYYIFNINLSFF